MNVRASRFVMILAMGAILFSAGLAPVWQDTAYAGDGTCGEASADGSTAWYFAEGYTGPGFREWLCLFNPQESWADLDLHILYNQGPSLVEEIALPPRSRVTFDINALAGTDAEISLYLESSERVVAERPMYFTYRGAWKGCTVSSRAEALSDVWYFAEGCTRQGFETWLLLANPRETSVRATVRLILEDGTVTPVVVSLPPRSRRTVFVNDEVGSGRDVSARVEADAPICAERVMYFDYHGGWPGGHASSGLSQPRNIYLFAEGYTGAGFEEWLTLYAPRESGGADGTDVTLNCLFQGGEEQSLKVHLDPDRRHTLFINQLAGEGKDVSLELSADEPFLAERPMYFNYRGSCRGGHVSSGVEEAGTQWYLAEGTTRPGFYEYLCLMNPGDTEATLTVDIISAQIKPTTLALTLAARSRLTVDVRATLGTGFDTSFEVVSDQPIAVERPLYYPTQSFEVANATDHLRHLSVNIGLRIEGTAGEEAAAAYLAAVLEGYGYDPVIQEVPLPNGAFTRNVIARMEPLLARPAAAGTGGKTLVVGGHYDTKMGTGSPGANDNGSGTVVVLELARCLAEQRVAFPVEFVFFGGEERLVEGTDLHHFGSRYYVNNLSQTDKDNLYGAIVVDMVGVGSQLYARTMGVGPMDLCNQLMAYAQGTGISLPYLLGGSYSDHEPFENAGIPVVWLEYMTDPWYHTPQDSFDKINPAHIENTGRLLEGFIRSL
ncbi:MAG: M28 family peptidase [Actinomycetota bacterium]|nr:M28 family peptidase [Actinomycetota bacterium]